jgi:hypothetical protein
MFKEEMVKIEAVEREMTVFGGYTMQSSVSTIN